MTQTSTTADAVEFAPEPQTPFEGPPPKAKAPRKAKTETAKGVTAKPRKAKPTEINKRWTHSWHPGPVIAGLLKLHDQARDEGTPAGLKLAAELLMKAAELKATLPRRKAAARPLQAAAPVDRLAVLAAQSEAEVEWLKTFGQKT